MIKLCRRQSPLHDDSDTAVNSIGTQIADHTTSSPTQNVRMSLGDNKTEEPAPDAGPHTPSCQDQDDAAATATTNIMMENLALITPSFPRLESNDIDQEERPDQEEKRVFFLSGEPQEHEEEDRATCKSRLPQEETAPNAGPAPPVFPCEKDTSKNFLFLDLIEMIHLLEEEATCYSTCATTDTEGIEDDVLSVRSLDSLKHHHKRLDKLANAKHGKQIENVRSTT